MKLLAGGYQLKTGAMVSFILACSLFSNAANAQADYSLVNVRDTVHINNCGSCHLPYSPGLLPMKSWLGIMSTLDDHFGVAVDLSEENSKHIIAYLEKFALADGQQSVMGQLAKDLPDNPPLRITKLPAFLELHSQASELMTVEGESQAFSACADCHRAAASHIFDKALLRVGHGDGPLSDYK